MKKRLEQSFFTVPTVQLARKPLGCMLVRETPAGIVAGTITETEAYTEDDPAAHSFSGKQTERNKTMFAAGGHLYVYLAYGIHHCLNIVSERERRGCAVLIRAIALTDGIGIARKNRGNKSDHTLTDGPGKICRALGISLADNGTDLTHSESPIYILGRSKKPNAITATPRIGISKARNKRWRFLIK